MLYEYIFFLLVKAYSIAVHHEKNLCSCVFLKVSIDHILITSSLEKESIVVEKSLEKVLSFGFKNLYKL